MTPMNYGMVEHVAYQVSDINWHTNFFQTVFGMKISKIKGDQDAPEIVWLSGGIQLISVAKTPEKMSDHIGMVVADLEATLTLVKKLPDVHPAQGKDQNWIILPDGAVLELIQGNREAMNRLRESPLR